ncbi:hypothetical protein B0H14DRAFT_3674068 [Mycena olivaceomarginata]|nr:hypothetical protein B0H14DRAFT_3674068 [Mycena olivaceomarginata]
MRRKIGASADPPGRDVDSFNNLSRHRRRAAQEWCCSRPPATPTNSKTLKSAPASKSKSTPAPKTTSKPDAEAAPPSIDKHASRPKAFAHTSSRAAPPQRYRAQLSALGHKKSANPTSSSNHKTPAGTASILYPAQQLAMPMAREEAVWRFAC